ncbi:hypothetical protein ACVLD2_002361 [Paenibacillus sp. PvR052]
MALINISAVTEMERRGSAAKTENAIPAVEAGVR